MYTYGLPKKYDDGDFSGIHTNIALTWHAANKDNIVALSTELTEAEIQRYLHITLP